MQQTTDLFTTTAAQTCICASNLKSNSAPLSVSGAGSLHLGHASHDTAQSKPLLTKTWSVAAITVAATVIFSMSPDRFAREYPNRVWIEDARPVAAWFVAQDFARGSVRATGVAHGPVNYELHRRAGLLRAVEIAEGPLDDSQLPIRLLSPVPEDGAESYPGRFLGRRKDLERVDRKVVGGVLIRTFDRAGER